MAQRLNSCNFCGSLDLTVIEEVNPETHEMNMNVILECGDCGEQDKYKVISHTHQHERDMGWTI